MPAVEVAEFTKTLLLVLEEVMAAQVVVVQVEAVQMVPLLIEHKQAQVKVQECQDNGPLVAVQVVAAGKVQILKAVWAALELLL
jgi:hypothetical protein